MTEPKIYTVGDARVACLADCALDSLTPERLLPDWRDNDKNLMEQIKETVTHDGRHVRLSVHSWVVWHLGKILIVDTGAGNGKERPHAPYFDHLKTPYLSRLRVIGVEPECVDYVLHTHLHVDHVGWNTTLVSGRWEPTFPNARHVFSRKEYTYFTDPANLTERHRTSFQAQADSVTPIVEAGLADMIEISLCGDRMIRTLLYEAAQIMLVRVTKWSWLKAWAMNVAKRRGMRKAIVALARRLAVIMHRMISDGTEFCWNRNDLPTAS